ncbi:MAG: signal peptidase I [Clostridia bacterium]|nr:signal peptidase I [Clostridia bacterium]
MKKVIGKIINTLLVALIIFAAGILVLVGVNAKSGKATTVLGYGFMAVQTGSMTPEYPIGSVIVIKETDPSELEVKDVITFYSSNPNLNNMIVTHRIMEITDDGDGTYSLVTQGDANEIPDEYSAESEKIIGKVVAKSNLMEKLMKVRENPAIFLLVVVLPMCFIITLELVNISKKMNEKTNEDDEKKKKQ